MHPEVLDIKGKKVFSLLPAFSRFYLAGGTALALQIGHRKSVDFDFFTNEEISEELFQDVERVFKGFTIHPLVNNKDELTVYAHEVKITFLKYPFPVLYEFVPYENINLLTVKEIAAVKAYTIGRRGSFKDYVDVYFLLKENHVALHEILHLADQKFEDAFSGRLFLEQLTYLDDITDTEVVFLKDKVGKKEIAEYFLSEIQKLKL